MGTGHGEAQLERGRLPVIRSLAVVWYKSVMKPGVVIAAFVVALSFAVLANATGSTYLIGAGIYDITGPAQGGTFFASIP